MKNKYISLGLLILVALVIVPGASAYGSYVGPLTTVYGSGSCGICHVNPHGGGARNAYGTLFENQANHMTAPAAALSTIGAPPGVTPTPTSAPISEPALKTIKVAPGSANLVAGESRSFVARTLDQFNQAISALVTWVSSNPSVGIIDSNGKFTALTDGTTTITASNGPISGSATVTVSNASVANNHRKEYNDREHKDREGISEEHKAKYHEEEPEEELENELDDD